MTDEEIKRLKEEKHAIDTRKAMDTAMRTLSAYVKEKKLISTLSQSRKTELNTILERFFVEARRENGENYKKIRYTEPKFIVFKQNRGFEVAKEEKEQKRPIQMKYFLSVFPFMSVHACYLLIILPNTFTRA